MRVRFGIGLPFVLALASGASAQVFPKGYCTYWAAKRFDETSPAPHCNWLGDAIQWIPNAAKDPADGLGWVISTNIHDVVPGSILVFGGSEYGHVSFVESVSPTGVNISEMNWGKRVVGLPDWITDNYDVPSNTYLPFSTGFNRDNGQAKFLGIILPTTLRSLIAESKPWHVFYNKETGDVAYSVNQNFGVDHKGYELAGSQGRVFDHPEPDTIPIYCYFNTDTQTHFYTKEDADMSKTGYYKIKDATIYAFEEKESLPGFRAAPMNRFVSSNGLAHLYTLLPVDQIGKPWKFEKAEFYVINQPVPATDTVALASSH